MGVYIYQFIRGSGCFEGNNKDNDITQKNKT